MQNAVAGTAMLTDGFEDEIDSVTPRSPAVGMGVGAAPGAGLGGLGIGVGGKKVRLFGEAGGPGSDRLDFKLAAAAVLSSGPGSGSDEDEVSEFSPQRALLSMVWILPTVNQDHGVTHTATPELRGSPSPPGHAPTTELPVSRSSAWDPRIPSSPPGHAPTTELPISRSDARDPHAPPHSPQPPQHSYAAAVSRRPGNPASTELNEIRHLLNLICTKLIR
ncbi:UNVERIFIED_CONTAM: hypothetical protein FKN15_077377 [Acipenser sinensis]